MYIITHNGYFYCCYKFVYTPKNDNKFLKRKITKYADRAKRFRKKISKYEIFSCKTSYFYNELFNDIAKAKEIDPFSEDFFL